MSNVLPLYTIYTTLDPNFNPNTTKNNLFVGEWELLPENEYLINAGKNIKGNNTIGSNSVTLTANNLPPHGHPYKYDMAGASGTAQPIGKSAGGSTSTAVGDNTTTNTPIDNRPKSRPAYRWVRIS